MTARYPAHPLALIVPPMTPDEYRELKADIKANGLEQPITLYEGKILDGIHRERACAELGIEVETRDWRKRNGQTPVQYVLSMNGHRRHLSPGQKAALAVELAKQMRKMYPATSGGSDERGDPMLIGEALGIAYDDDAVRDATTQHIPPALLLSARAVGAAPKTTVEVQTLATKAPKLYAKVRDGLMTVMEATRERKAAEPKPRKSRDEITDGLIRQLIAQLKNAADTVATLESREVELAGPNLLFVWGYAFTVAATIKNIAKQANLPETKAGAQKLLARATQ